MDWWVAQLLRDNPVLLVSWVVWVIGSVVLHELAHGWVAIHEGDDTPVATGHMTWNPIVHMGWMSLLFFALVGLAWGMMPVNPSRFRSRHGAAKVAAAGPAMNVALARLCVVLLALWRGYFQSVPDPLWRNVSIFLTAGAFLNASLAVFNLLPVPPLDGSRILADFSDGYRRFMDHPNVGPIATIVLLVLMFRAGSLVTGPVASFTLDLAARIQSVLPGAQPPTRADAGGAEWEEMQAGSLEASPFRFDRNWSVFGWVAHTGFRNHRMLAPDERLFATRKAKG